MPVPLVTLLVASLASYLAIVHMTAFSTGLAYARSASKVAILLMDGLLVAHLAAGRRGLFRALWPPPRKDAAYLKTAGPAWLALIAVIALHLERRASEHPMAHAIRAAHRHAAARARGRRVVHVRRPRGVRPASPAVTEGYGGIPDGAVRDGIVMIGRDKGKPLLPIR